MGRVDRLPCAGRIVVASGPHRAAIFAPIAYLPLFAGGIKDRVPLLFPIAVDQRQECLIASRTKG